MRRGFRNYSQELKGIPCKRLQQAVQFKKRKMMHYAKLASSGALAVAKGEIDEALHELDADPNNAQSVYTNLTRIFEVVADHLQAGPAVDSALAAHKNVQLLRELVRLHLREEEVQWVLGRVVASACRASRRFQCQAGQLELWNELFDMRSAHLQSIRVQEASLQATETLFSSNEFHVTKIRPRPLLDDLVGVMRRFQVVQTPRRRAHKLVVFALRVLVALYSPPRLPELMLFDGHTRVDAEQWTREISSCMLESFSVFNKDADAISTWLNMALLLLRQHPTPALEILFSSASSNGALRWLVAVVERWQPNADVMYSLLTTLTHIFALPHHTSGAQNQVALVDHGLLDIVCGVIGLYCCSTSGVNGGPNTDATTAPSAHYARMLLLLEVVRFIRQCSERPTLLPRFEALRVVKTTLLPVLIDQLQWIQHELAPSSAFSSKRLVFTLEILLILRHLAAVKSLRGVLVASDTLETSLKWLGCGKTCRPASGGSSSGSTARSVGAVATINYEDDGDLDALVAREALHLLTLVLANPAASSRLRFKVDNSAALTNSVASPVRKQNVVKSETIRAYSIR